MRIRAKTKAEAVEFDADPAEALLYAGLRAGLPLPYECATGTCGTCKARRVEGEIVASWEAAPGAGYLKPERGEFLMCQSTASADCRIDIPAAVDQRQRPRVVPVYGRATITQMLRLTHDVVAVHLDLDTPLTFDAGQFIVLRAPGIEGYRAYSMVNFAQPARNIEFVIKRKPGGHFTDWLFDREVVGSSLEWFGPLGKAVFDPAEQRTMLCIAGGSGIASIMSILARAQEARHFDHFDAQVFFGVRGNDDVFYLDRFSAYVSAFPGRLGVTIALSHEAPSEALARAHPGLTLAGGFVHEVAAKAMAGKTAGRVAYLAGPPPMVDAAIRMLVVQARLPARDIRYDKFG